MAKFTTIFLVLTIISFLSPIRGVVESDKYKLVKYYQFLGSSAPLEIEVGNLKNLRFREKELTFVIIDGFLSSLTAQMSSTVPDVMFKQFPLSNIIVVDWSKMSGSEVVDSSKSKSVSFLEYIMTYNKAKSKVEFAGQHVAKFIYILSRSKKIDFSKLHLIGFSLGAHIAGVAGLHLYANYNKRIGRITGLDPAGLGFPMSKPEKRLDMSDAGFVDVYFTNKFIAGDFENDVGHVNVFVNGGRRQPGCDSYNLMTSTICNHAFSWVTWNKCLKEKCIACPCTEAGCQSGTGVCSIRSGVLVGMNVSVRTNGDFYLKQELPAEILYR